MIKIKRRLFRSKDEGFDGFYEIKYTGCWEQNGIIGTFWGTVCGGKGCMAVHELNRSKICIIFLQLQTRNVLPNISQTPFTSPRNGCHYQFL